MSAPAIHRHHKSQSCLLPLLSAHLPYSGPLFRRIQHSLIYPSETAQILATFPPAPTAASVNAYSPWLVVSVDVYAGSETQIWLYSSVEAGASVPSIQEWAAIEELPLAIDIYDLLQATMTGPEKIPPHLPRIRIPPHDSGVYIKYIFHRSTYDPPCKEHGSASEINDSDSGLPQGYRFHDLKRRVGVQAQQLDLVLSRTDIPRSKARSKEILEQNHSVAVYYDGGADDTSSSCPGGTANRAPDYASGEMPVAWAFSRAGWEFVYPPCGGGTLRTRIGESYREGGNEASDGGGRGVYS
ncbi:hypothetical protein BDDG_00489 [Blastomyces dermatitidis ATCC 18188]|uniref:Uncharacterized protein n=1 Tax=Ajellomyces dermatitidis (strain ATCC 18188 / CBS 674.68) TaxID=653446 RepID=F2T268_AJEDA|nr:hypothetical protein BDDG_00489 [Blastomyces dermatitidis ATCC 18188]